MQTPYKRKPRRWPWIVAILVLGIFILSKSCKKDTTLKVSTAKAQKRTLVETVDENGKLYPQNEMSLTADPGATIEAVYVREGDTVAKGQAIALVKTEQLNTVAAKSAAPPDLKSLAGAGGLNPAAIAQMLQQNQPPAMPSVKRQAKLQTLTAPIGGVVTYLPVKKGDRATGMEIARVAAINSWEVKTDVGEADVVKLAVGNTVAVEIDALPGKKFRGTVQRIASGSAAQQANIPGNFMSDVTTYKVYISITAQQPDSGAAQRPYTLRPGMNARVHIETRTATNVIAVPVNAVTTRLPEEAATPPADGSYPVKETPPDVVVFVMNNGHVKMKKVSTGIQDMNYIEVIAGLAEGEEVVSEPYDAIEKTLTDGLKVKVVKKAELFKKN
jgi:HlyD family secretion protein